MKFSKKVLLDFKTEKKFFLILYLITIATILLFRNTLTNMSFEKIQTANELKRVIMSKIFISFLFITTPLIYDYFIIHQLNKKTINAEKSIFKIVKEIVLYVFTLICFLILFFISIGLFSLMELEVFSKLLILIPILAGFIFFYKLMFFCHSLIKGEGIIDSITISNELVDRNIIKVNLISFFLLFSIIFLNIFLVKVLYGFFNVYLFLMISLNFLLFCFVKIIQTNLFINFSNTAKQ